MEFNKFTMLYFWSYVYVLYSYFNNIFESVLPLNMIFQQFLLPLKFKAKEWNHSDSIDCRTSWLFWRREISNQEA